jgi:hypothetical protein
LAPSFRRWWRRRAVGWIFQRNIVIAVFKCAFVERFAFIEGFLIRWKGRDTLVNWDRNLRWVSTRFVEFIKGKFLRRRLHFYANCQSIFNPIQYYLRIC